MTVYLVGAGPGDPGLLTRRGEELLRGADVVVYDRLASPALLDLAPAAAERVDVGKAPGRAAMNQEQINDVLVTHGREGKVVVRLKGGDPFVFGRGGEEAEACIAAQVPFEVVPGVTSAIAAPAYAGIPVTHRGVSTSVTIVTGHEDPAKGTLDTDWDALAAREERWSSSWARAVSPTSRARSSMAADRPRRRSRPCGGGPVRSSAPRAPRSRRSPKSESKRRPRSSSARSPRSTSRGSSSARCSAAASS